MSVLFSRLSQQFRSAPRYQRILGYFVTIYFIFAIFLGLITPYIIEQQAPIKISQLLGRNSQLSSVSINPFTLKVTINDFNIAEPSGKSFVYFDSFIVQVNFWQSLLNLSINVEQIKLNQLAVNIEKFDETSFNFSDILTRLAESSNKNEPHQEEPKPQTAPPLIQVKLLELNNSSINFSDNVSDALLSIPDINFSLQQFNNRVQLNEQVSEHLFNRYDLAITAMDNSAINTQGEFQVAPLQVNGELTIKELQLPSLWAFVAKQFQPKLNSGVINIASNYTLNTVDSIQEISTNNGIFSLRELNFTHAKKPLIKLPLLTITDINTDLTTQQVNINNISTNGLVLHAKVNKQGVDLATLFQPKTDKIQPKTDKNLNNNSSLQDSAASTTKADEKSMPWLVKLASFQLKNYSLRVNESLLTAGTDWQITPLNITTGPLRSDLISPIDFAIDFAVNNKGKFSAKGKAQADKQSVTSSFELSKLQLAQFQPYLKDKLNINIESGNLSSKGLVVVDGTKQLKTDINLALDDLKINDSSAHSELVSWRALNIEKLKFNQSSNSLNINKITLNQPYSQFVIDSEGINNFSTLSTDNEDDSLEQTTTASSDGSQKKATNAASQEKTTETEKLLIEINEILIHEGKFDFNDQSIKPSYTAKVSKLNAKLGRISSTTDKNAQLDIDAVVNDYAPMRLVGEVNPLIEKPYLNLNFAFDHFELPSVTPYTNSSVGLDIDEGQLNLDLNYNLEEDQLKGSNSIFVDQLHTSDSKDSEANSLLPIGLAIPLLQNSKGEIKLDVKVNGDINDPEFNISELVLKALGNIIVKAATSPFTLLAGLVESDESLDKINFEAGSSVLDMSEQHKLASLAKALTQRPKVKLNIKGSYNANSDWLSLANRAVNEKLTQLSKIDSRELSANALPESGPVIDALLTLFRNETKLDSQVTRANLAKQHTQLTVKQLDKLWHEQVYQQVSKIQVISISDFNELAAKRANAVKVYLQNANKIAANRMFVLSHQKDVSDTESQALLTLVTK